MLKYFRLLLVLMATLIPLPGALLAAEYSSSSGIEFQYPDSWVAVSAATLDLIPGPERDYIREKGIDLNSMEACVLDTAPDEFAENLNVVATPGQNATNERNLAKAVGEIRKMYEQAGIPVRSLTGKVVQAAGRSCYEIDQLTTIQGNNLHQKQLIIPGGGQTFFVTLTTLDMKHDQYVSVMEKVKATLQVPALRGGFDWGQVGIPAWSGESWGV